ncbi:AMP-binding enzyme [Reticulomyxa filosa]|uniref:AMP-binding enzyme n=1 Tax=Reticulomyxa filosa TaxID=46433 RepID=X6P5B7_RETFI|nr:AMP-binding enzyme [Reticulomyxa filosa]|eukprot:ETO33745.1 AMP-binding enzyme [Reticulomyxa filosa]
MLQMCLDEKVTLLLGVPTVVQGIRQELTSFPSKYKTLKGQLTRFLCGGSAPPGEMIQWFHDTWNIELIQIWGMTEMSPLGTIGRRHARRLDLHIPPTQNQNQQKPGLLVPGVEAKIVDSENMNNVLSWDGKQKGELLVRYVHVKKYFIYFFLSTYLILSQKKKMFKLSRGPSVTKEYFQNPAETKFKGEWLITGDVASFTDKAQLIIRDRSKDMIKSGGEWIESIGMENLVMSLPAVSRACVIGVPHDHWGERPIVVAQLHDGHQLTHADVLTLLAQHYAKFQLPDDLLIWKEVPLTSTLKIDKKVVRKILQEQKYVLPSANKSTQAKLEFVTLLQIQKSNKKNITTDFNLFLGSKLFTLFSLPTFQKKCIVLLFTLIMIYKCFH